MKIGSTQTSTVTATQARRIKGVTNNADQTSANTANDVTNVDGTAAATVKGGAAKADLGLTSLGVVKKLVPKEQGGLAEDISAKTGVLDFSSGTADFRATLPTNRGGFGLDVGNLFGTNVGRLPRWNGSAFVSVAETDFKNTEIIDSNGNIKETIGLALPSSGGVFSPTEFKNIRESFDNIGNSSTIKLAATKVPIDETNFFEVDSNVIKIKECYWRRFKCYKN